MILCLSLHLPEDPTYIRTTRLLSRCLLGDIKVNADIIDDIEFIVGELCSNVIRHAQSQAPHFLMTLEYYKPKVVIKIVDEGRGFAEESILPVGAMRCDRNGEARVSYMRRSRPPSRPRGAMPTAAAFAATEAKMLRRNERLEAPARAL